ncbi:YqjF family protein [Owenweeksia hongkongensis]|uniref:YqjF family protein n=1 Tax=Owenweeksia hongkongensis TaxID=253245 RepID=UPI003A8D87A1
MTTSEILKTTDHRPWKLPTGNWKYYQEWNDAVFLHWEVEYSELRKFIPENIEIDLFDGKPWVSLVAFKMEKIRPKNLPSFPPVSNFDEINIRTYVKFNNKSGVYFLSIEAGSKISSQIAKSLSKLPYRYSKMNRQEIHYQSFNAEYSDNFEMAYQIGQKQTEKTKIDKWLVERYALFQDDKGHTNEFEIHHIEWPTYKVELKKLMIDYPRFGNLLSSSPTLAHYSPGVQVIAWGKKKL